MPEPYDYFIIGTGPAGQTVAHAAAEAGHRVGVADYQPYGGTCPLRGCDPKKVLLAAARAMNATDRLKGKGFTARPPFDWAALQKWKNEFTDDIPEGTVSNFEEAGIDCFHGEARFTAPHRLTIGQQEIQAENIVIATGATPAPLDFPGAELLKTSDEFLEMKELPGEIVIVGGGYIGAEFAHIACILGASVTVIAAEDSPVAKFDDDLNDLLAGAAAQRGMTLLFSTKATRAESEASGRVRVTVEDQKGQQSTITADQAFHAAGRVPNIRGLGLDNAGIHFGDNGIAVDSSLCTSAPAHYAVGDCNDAGLPLTPVATHEAKLLADNLFRGKTRQIDYYPIPTLAFTIPPIASVGMTAEEAEKSDKNLRINFAETTDWFHTKHANGIVSAHKIIIDQDKDILLGAHLLGPGADELINLFALIIREKIPLENMRNIPWAYPTAGSNLSGMLKTDKA